MKDKLIEGLEERISRLNEIGQQPFVASDFPFGFYIWRNVTELFLKQNLPEDTSVIEALGYIRVEKMTSTFHGYKDYNLEACKREAKEILEMFIKTIEMKNQLVEEKSPDEDIFWNFLHPTVVNLAKERFDNGYYSDAVLACLKEANTIIKNHVKAVTNKEYDGAALMTTAFSAQNPIITFADIGTDNGRNIQLGYMKIFEGAMIGIRNPKSHENMNPDKAKTVHFLFIASFMFIKLEDSGILNSKKGS